MVARITPLRLALPLASLLALVACQPGLKAQEATSENAENGDAAEAARGPVEQVYRTRQYEAAVTKADELVAAGQVDPDNEYWAARALRVLKRYDEAAERFEALSKRFPTAEIAASADIDAEIARMGKIPSGPPDAAARKMATAVGVRLMSVAKKHEARPEARARALYIGGNAFRMGQADPEAITAYGDCMGLEAAASGGYPAKCALSIGTIHSRMGDDEAARSVYRQCSMQQHDGPTATRCAKALARTELVGLPAPELEIETWLNSTPQPLSSKRGKVVMLFFFATWCPHCKDTLPTLPAYAGRFEGQPFEIMAITNNVRGQTTESAKLFIQDPQWEIDYPVAVDARGATTTAMEASGIPQIILIDKKGIVRWSDHPAYLTEAVIERLLAEPGPT